MAAIECYQNKSENENSTMIHQSENGRPQENNSQKETQQQQQHQNDSNHEQQQATAGIPGKDDERKLFIGGLSRHTTEKDLRDHFCKFGEIESVSVKMDQYTGISRGFAFMVFTNPRAIDKLLAAGAHYVNMRKVDAKRVCKKAHHGKIFVGGLTPDITDDDIKTYFSQYGTVVEIQAPFDKTKNQRKGFCFITFDSKDVVYKLLKTPKQSINGKEVDVKKVKVNPETNRQGYWGFGYGHGYNSGYGYIPEYGNGYQGGYDDSYGNYDSYAGYDSFDNNMSYQMPGKPRGNGQGPRQFPRHQPY